MTAQRLPQPLTDAEIIQVLAHADPATPIGLRNRALLETGYRRHRQGAGARSARAPPVRARPRHDRLHPLRAEG